MAVRTKTLARRRLHEGTFQIDTNGDSFICTVQQDRNEVTVDYDIVSGSVTSVNITRKTGLGTIKTYGGDSLLTDGIPKTVKGGADRDLYVTVAGASSLVATITFNQSR